MKKKGAAIAFNTIIIAAIALVVLAVVMYLLISKTEMFHRGTGDCEARRGECINGTCPDNNPILAFKGCYKDGQYDKNFNCCIGVGG
jgi:hypothetical protein